MENQTENYIILKPIAERFNKVASSITDEDIKSLIFSEMRNKLQAIDFRSEIEEIIGDYLDNNSDEVLGLFKTQLINKFK